VHGITPKEFSSLIAENSMIERFLLLFMPPENMNTIAIFTELESGELFPLEVYPTL